jgi:hypothetical protein
VQSEADRYAEVRGLQRRWRVRHTPHGLRLDITYATAGSTYAYPVAMGAAALPVHVDDGQVRILLPGALQAPRALCVSFAAAPGPAASGILPQSLTLRRAGRLGQAQHAVFCSEVFSGLARDAARVATSGIHAKVADDVLSMETAGSGHVYVALRPLHLHPQARHSHHGHGHGQASADAPPAIYASVVSVLMHQAVREHHRQRQRHREGHVHSMPNVPLAVLHTWASHVAVRQRLASIFGVLAVGVQEPRIAVHWACAAAGAGPGPGACVSTAEVTAHVGPAETATVRVTLDGARVWGLSMYGRRDALSEAGAPLYVMQHIATAMVRALTHAAVARGWRVVRRQGHTVAVQRRLTVITLRVDASLQPFSIAVSADVDTQVCAVAWGRPEPRTTPLYFYG